MTFKTSPKSQTISIYNLRSDTKEFIGKGDAYIPPHTGLPADCTEIKPPAIPAGMVAIFSDGAWSIAEDHRGEVVYCTDTGKQMVITEPGPFPTNATSIASPGEFVKWDGKKWVEDTDAQKHAAVDAAKVEKAQLFNRASLLIQTLNEAVTFNMATDEEIELLTVWQKYRVLLNRVDPESAPDIEWPELPDNVA